MNYIKYMTGLITACCCRLWLVFISVGRNLDLRDWCQPCQTDRTWVNLFSCSGDSTALISRNINGDWIKVNDCLKSPPPWLASCLCDGWVCICICVVSWNWSWSRQSNASANGSVHQPNMLTPPPLCTGARYNALSRELTVKQDTCVREALTSLGSDCHPSDGDRSGAEQWSQQRRWPEQRGHHHWAHGLTTNRQHCCYDSQWRQKRFSKYFHDLYPQYF